VKTLKGEFLVSDNKNAILSIFRNIKATLEIFDRELKAIEK
jgi:hypothetical protein